MREKIFEKIESRAMDIDVHKRHEYLYVWNLLRCDEIESQEIANALFDFAVNSGISDAVKALQNAINWFYVGGEQLKVDGIIGEETISALDVACANDGEIAIRLRFHSYRLAHILECIGNGTIHKSMAKGLARRAMV